MFKRFFIQSTPRAVARFSSALHRGQGQGFPSLTIKAHELTPRGAFALAQSEYLSPDQDMVKELDEMLHRNNVGVVAHFYMDPELQGILQAVSWPHVFIADSLAMGDAAVRMVHQGRVNSIAVLGVDFMAENVQATLRSDGLTTPIFRLSPKHIGCSLAESAEGANYVAFLEQARLKPNALHVVYINTSLHTKARAHALVPTITCTSSNVVQTILQAAAQVPDVHIFFGPDTYMGENLVRTFEHMLAYLTDAEIAALHPQHSRATLAALLTRFDYFRQGNCVVHHMFDEHVARQLRTHYPDAFLTAHLEVPGPMFELSLEAKARGRGAVGSTADILNFITETVLNTVQLHPTHPVKLPFVLGTEAGMITGIVAKVQQVLRRAPNAHVSAEIIFPVSSEAVTAAPDSELGIVPGAASGEGCSAGGGCATCPFMKMNTLDSLMDVVRLCGSPEPSLALAKYQIIERKPSAGVLVDARLGVVPINHMRAFQSIRALSADLVQDVLTRRQATAALEQPTVAFAGLARGPSKP